jgi:NCS1 family nucleobase:cation symporter-1
VGSHFNRIFGKHDRVDTDGFEWSCGRNVRNSVSCFRARELWFEGRKCARSSPGASRLRLVWDPNLDRWIRAFSDATLPQIFPETWGLETGPAILFFLFWCLNMYVVYLGIDSIKKLLVFKAIFLPVSALLLLGWAIWAAHGLGPILSQPSKFASDADFWTFFFPALTGMVGFWATVSLNIPDFTRYAVSQRAQILGQAIALPTAMTSFAFVGVVVTSASAIVFGSMVWDPVVLAGKFESPLLVTFAMLAVAISTLATNIAANIVSPANDFSNLSPSKIDFRKGGYITGVIGILIFPWKLIADPTGYIFTWLIAYSSLLGPIGGILIADYYFVRDKKLVVDELYVETGRYWYSSGVNWKAIVALVAGILPNVPGFLVAIKIIDESAFPHWINELYHYAWFVGFAVASLLYWAFMRKTSNKGDK